MEHIGIPRKESGLVQKAAAACSVRAPVCTTEKTAGNHRCRFSRPPKIALKDSGRTRNYVKVF